MQVTNSHDQRSVLQSQEVTQRFLNNPTVLRKQEVLRMLIKMSELSARNQEGTASPTQISPLSSGRRAKRISTKPRRPIPAP